MARLLLMSAVLSVFVACRAGNPDASYVQSSLCRLVRASDSVVSGRVASWGSRSRTVSSKTLSSTGEFTDATIEVDRMLDGKINTAPRIDVLVPRFVESSGQSAVGSFRNSAGQPVEAVFFLRTLDVGQLLGTGGYLALDPASNTYKGLVLVATDEMSLPDLEKAVLKYRTSMTPCEDERREMAPEGLDSGTR